MPPSRYCCLYCSHLPGWLPKPPLLVQQPLGDLLVEKMVVPLGWYSSRLKPPPGSPLKGDIPDIPNKYSLYKVYMWAISPEPEPGGRFFEHQPETTQCTSFRRKISLTITIELLLNFCRHFWWKIPPFPQLKATPPFFQGLNKPQHQSGKLHGKFHHEFPGGYHQN